MVAERPAFTASPNTRPRYANAYSEAIEMQDVLAAQIKDPKTPKQQLARLVDAWDKLEDRKRILRNKPLPGSYVHEKQRVTKRAATLGASMLASLVSAEQTGVGPEQPGQPQAEQSAPASPPADPAP